jgi:hypothetical protein
MTTCHFSGITGTLCTMLMKLNLKMFKRTFLNSQWKNNRKKELFCNSNLGFLSSQLLIKTLYFTMIPVKLILRLQLIGTKEKNCWKLISLWISEQILLLLRLEVELLEDQFMKIQVGTKQDLKYVVTSL